METSLINTAVIIGAGNVATHLAAALQTAGVTIKAVWSRNIANATTLAKALSDTTTATNTLADIPTDAAIYIIAVSDDAIADIAAQLPPVNGIVAHTSGTIPANALQSAQGNGYGSFYPLQTFSKSRPIQLTDVPFFIEGDTPQTTARLHTLAAKISTRVIDANSQIRGQLHLAAVFASNFANVLWGVADDVLSKANLSLDILNPLLVETLAKAIEIGPDNAQTGPAKRNDQVTIGKHLDKISDPDLKEIYTRLTNLIIKRQCQK